MKNKLFTIFILAFGLLKAQSELSYLSTEVTNDIITFDFQKSKNTVIKFVNENKGKNCAAKNARFTIIRCFLI